MGVLGSTFPLSSFLSIDAVGSEVWTALHEYINGDTHQRVPSHSPIYLLSVRLIDFVVGCLVWGLPAFNSMQFLSVATAGPETW